jgi:hypothetical protein
MNKLAEVISPHGDHEENIERIVKFLGRDKLRLRIFDFIHGRGSRPKTVTQICAGLQLKPARRQVALNQVNYLAKHRIISRSGSSTVGRAELAYGKNDFCMANKQEILRNVAKPQLLKRIPTKRRPQISGVPAIASATRKRGSRQRKLKILYLLANPASQGTLRTDAEFRLVQDEVRSSRYRSRINLISSPAADAKSILNGINDHRPQIVHFSGHGGGRGIWLDDGKVHKSVGKSMGFSLLAETLGATTSPPRLLVLNACDTLTGSKKLLEAVEVVIAMSDNISDVGAAIFAAQFYAGIASAQPISHALKQGIVSMKAASLNDAHLPKMVHRKEVDPRKIILV